MEPVRDLSPLIVQVVVLIGLDVGLHLLCRHEPDVMALLPQGTSEVVRASAGFRSNQDLLSVRSKD